MPPTPPASVRQVQRVLAALDHAVRQRVLAALYNADDAMSFTELADRVGVSRPRLAQHLKPLVQTALVLNTYRKGEGREYSFYEITAKGRDWLERVGLADSSAKRAWPRSSSR